MPRPITALGITVLKPRAKRYEKPLGGSLYVIVQPSGHKSYAVGGRSVQMPVRMSADRLARVRAARDRALEIARTSGRQNGDGEVWANAEDFLVVHRTPFSKPLPEPRASNYLEAQLLQRFVPALPYTMDVWYQHKKVMNVSWDSDDRIRLISFRPGAWEEKLATVAQ